MNSTIPEAFFETAELLPKKTALLYKKEGVYFPITYKELASRVKVACASLQKLGVKKGDAVALLSENRPEWVVADLAIMEIGGICVPLHATLNPKAIHQILDHCRANILIVSSRALLNKFLLARNSSTPVQKVIFMEKLTDFDKQNPTTKMLNWKLMLEHNKEEGYEKIFSDPDEMCTIIYTSGTTGNPKGVMLSHNNILSNVEAVNQVVPVKKTDILLSSLPLSHVLERTVGYYTPLLFGATIAYAENIKQLAANLREVTPTVLLGVPRMFEKFHDTIWDKMNAGPAWKKALFKWALKQKRGTPFYLIADAIIFRRLRNRFGGRLRLTVSGGASLSENLAQFFSKIGILILEGYGLTETSPVIATNRQKDVKFGTVGKIVPGVKVKISNKKEIMVQGPSVFAGYFNDEQETNAAFDNRWFLTGDLGFLDKRGFLTIIGREKEMFVLSGGKNIWPEPIESLLNSDKFILQSIVIGNKHKFVSALIVPDWQEIEIYLKKNNMPLQDREKLLKNPAVLALFEQRMEEKINANLSEVEQIKRFKLLTSQFSQENEELTPTLKLRRHIIEKRYEREIGELYTV